MSIDCCNSGYWRTTEGGGSYYDIGDVVRSIGTFSDPINSNVLIDPTAVFFAVRNPAGSVLEYQYGVDAEVVRDSAGIYYFDINVTMAGIWYHRWFSTGLGQASEERWFTARAAKAVL